MFLPAQLPPFLKTKINEIIIRKTGGLFRFIFVNVDVVGGTCAITGIAQSRAITDQGVPKGGGGSRLH